MPRVSTVSSVLHLIFFLSFYRADPNTGNILNFNVGDNVDLSVPRTFWSRLAGRFGTKFYWRDNGEDAAIVNAVAAIDNCLREPLGKLQCNTIRGELE